MNLRKQKKLVARAFGVSPKRIRFNIENADSKKAVSEVISREAARELLAEKIVTKLPVKGISRTRANFITAQKKKGRKQGHGSRKGTANARHNTKTAWVTKIRGLRAYLNDLRDSGKLDVKKFRELYLKCKGNFFRSKRHLALYLQQNSAEGGVAAEGVAEAKPVVAAEKKAEKKSEKKATKKKEVVKNEE